MDFNTCTENELWEFVAIALSKKGIQTILVGGAVAAIYSDGAYRSGDLDIIVESYNIPDSRLAETMTEIGFSKSGRHWIHPDCSHLYVEFISPPVAIGDDYSIKPIELSRSGQLIKIISAEDCVRDRLASYVYFKARECLDQAYLVAIRNDIDLNRIEIWAKKEGKAMVNAVKELKEKLEANKQ
jgi:hypothetical protein